MITGEPRDTERVMRGSERGCWKSAFVLLKATRWQPTLPQVRFLGELRSKKAAAYPTMAKKPHTHLVLISLIYSITKS